MCKASFFNQIFDETYFWQIEIPCYPFQWLSISQKINFKKHVSQAVLLQALTDTSPTMKRHSHAEEQHMQWLSLKNGDGSTREALTNTLLDLQDAPLSSEFLQSTPQAQKWNFPCGLTVIKNKGKQIHLGHPS